MRIGIRRLHPDARIPTRGTPGSAGWDLYALHRERIGPECSVVIRTGIAVVLPEGWEAQVRPRSGLAAKHDVTIMNSPGTIDSDYQGEIHVQLVNHSPFDAFIIDSGARIAQMVFTVLPSVTLVETTEEPRPTERGTGGMGSTGR